MKITRIFRMTLPFLLLGSLSAQGADIILNQGSAKIVFTYGANINAQKQAALQAAAAEVEQIVRFDQNVKVTVSFASLSCDTFSAVLGQAGPDGVTGGFAGAPQSNTWYVYAEAADLGYAPAMALSNHITAQFNNDIGTINCLTSSPWYFGTDHNPPANAIDFVSVIKHELMHGLGFLSLVGSDGTLNGGYMDNYSSFLYDNSTGKSWKSMTDAERGASELNDQNLVWSGAKGKAMVGLLQAGVTNGQARLFAPATYQSGSSISHWDTSLKYVTGADELMEPVYNTWMQFGVTAGAFCDMGWGIVLDTDGDGKNDCADTTPVSRQLVKNDFDADGKSDALFVNSTTGGTQYWKAANRINVVSPGSYDHVNYSYAGSGDFDGNGKTDLLFIKTSNNATLIWNGAVKTSASYPGAIAADYAVAAICDTNGDGKDDIVWFSATTGKTQIWPSASKAGIIYPGTGVAGFSIVACGDFDGDGKADLFWDNATSGANQIWLGAVRANKTYPGTNTDLTMTVVGAGDIDADGKSDVIWYKPSTSTINVWKGGLKSATTYPGSNNNAGFTPKAIGDYDGDGKADLLWGNDTTLATEVWSGVAKANAKYPGASTAGYSIQK